MTDNVDYVSFGSRHLRIGRVPRGLDSTTIQDVAAWIEDRYNRRRHSSIEHLTPVDFEMQFSSQVAEIQLAA
ncbi:hypothetical protein QN355_17740 [Cryobacterium sp. 10S3]|nr:hypothetical protein [Cryobacterium sp. 10S3]